MNFTPLRQAASLLCSLLLFSSQASAQEPGILPQKPLVKQPQTQAMLHPDPKRAQKAAERGDKAVAQGRIEDALADYDEAAHYAPQDVAIVGRAAGLRSKLVREHADTAERQALAGDLGHAQEELRLALNVDPDNTIVAERLAQMQAMEEQEPHSKLETQFAGVPRLQPKGGKQSFTLHGDTRTVYEQVALAFGMKAAFDPDLVARPVKLQVNDVDLFTALSLLGTESGTFWRPVNPTLFFVAADTQEKRREYGLQAERTFALAASVGPEEMTELLRVLREITGATRVELDSHSRTITMRDSPATLALAGEVIQQVEQARGEVMLEIELLEVDTNTARKLGITPPSASRLIPISTSLLNQLRQAKDLAALIPLIAPLFGTAGGGTSPSSLVPPLVVVGGGKSTFLLTLPGAAADFSDSLSLVRSGRQVLLRAQDGKPATFFVGDRFPVTLSLLSGSLGTGATIAGAPTSTTFPETTFSVGNNPVALAARDFNGDGLPDIAVANENDNSISILLNNNKGNFSQPGTSPILLGKNETGPAAIASAVLRASTPAVPAPAADLVVANSSSNTVSVLLGNGDGTFTEATGSPFATGKQPSAVVIADFDGDGNLDFAVANKGDSSISVFRGDGSGGFTPFPRSPFVLPNIVAGTETGSVAMVTANFRNRSKPDLAVVNESSNSISILLSSGDNTFDGTFSEATNSPVAVGKTPVAIAAGDFNGDAVPDLAVVNQADNSVTILLSNGDGTFSAATGSPLPTAATPAGIVVADFTNGANNDLVVTNQGQGTLAIYVGLGLGTFASRSELNAPASPGAIVTADFDADNLPDVALTAQGSTPKQGEVAVVLDTPGFATGATPTQSPYPASEYLDLGVKIKATPKLHDNNEVTLQLEFEIRALSGTSVNGIPVISNRTLSQTVRVKEDEPTLIGGLLDVEQTRTITGLPGFAEIPGAAGYAFSQHSNSLQDTELLILVTPRKLRLPPRSARTIFAGRGDTGGRGSVGANAPLAPPPQPPLRPEP
jgi:type II/III secretion system protein/VCBS repeat protein